MGGLTGEEKTKEELLEELSGLCRRVDELEAYRKEHEGIEAALRESEERFRNLIEQAVDAIFIHDTDGRFVAANQLACDSLKYPCPELLKLSVKDIEVNFVPGNIAALWKEMKPGEPVTINGMHRRSDGTTFPVEVRVGVIQSGERRFMLAIARDIAERKRAEEALTERACHAALGAEVGAALTTGATLREALQGCAEAMFRDLGAAFARIWTLNEKEGVLELQASAGMYTHIDGPHGRIAYNDRSKIGYIAVTRQSHLTNEVIGDPRVGDQEWAKKEGMVAFAGYPLVVQDRLVGVMAMFARKTLSETTLSALESVANVIALGIERIRSEEGLRASEARFRSMVEEALVGAYIIQDGRFVYFNREFCEIFGYTKEEIEGLTDVLELVHPDDRRMVSEILQRRVSGELENIRYEMRGLRKGNSIVQVEVLGWRADYKGRPAVIGTLVDITKRKRAEEERAALLSMLTHDIKGPLSVISGYGELLIEHVKDKECGNMLEEIIHASGRISRLINDMLEISRLESGCAALNIEQVSMPAVLKQAVSESEIAAAEMGLSLELEVGDMPEVSADKTQLGRAFANLVSNAVRYNRPGGRVVVRGGQLSGEEGQVFVEVSDTGIGVAEADLPHIFNRYYRSSRTRLKDGTGLGLAIVKAVVEAHGGTVSVTSREREGSTFRVVLPVRVPLTKAA